MSLTLMRPFSEMDEMFKHFDRSLGEFKESDWVPVVDIEEADKTYLFRVELPGVHKDDVHVTIDNNVLTVKGEKNIENEDTKRHRVERTYGSFVRSFALPQAVKTDNIKAKFVGGVLNLTIEKMADTKPKQIEVKVK